MNEDVLCYSDYKSTKLQSAGILVYHQFWHQLQIQGSSKLYCFNNFLEGFTELSKAVVLTAMFITAEEYKLNTEKKTRQEFEDTNCGLSNCPLPTAQIPPSSDVLQYVRSSANQESSPEPFRACSHRHDSHLQVSWLFGGCTCPHVQVQNTRSNNHTDKVWHGQDHSV